MCRSLKELRLLYVEDETYVHAAYKRAFDKYFLGVDSAYNGIEAWELFQKNRYDLVLTDIDMPLMTGVELIKRIFGLIPSMCVVVLSGSDDEIKHKMLELGVKQFISKPASINVVKKLLQESVCIPVQ